MVMEGTPKEVFARVEELKKIGLDVPQTTELLYSLKKSGMDIKADLLSVDECVEELLSKIKRHTGGAADAKAD